MFHKLAAVFDTEAWLKLLGVLRRPVFYPQLAVK
jgi:hypothetical protein